MINNRFPSYRNSDIKPYVEQELLIQTKKKLGLHIAMFTNNYLPFVGGVPLSIDRMASALRKEGHRVFIFAPEYPGDNYQDHEDTVRCRTLAHLRMTPVHFPISNIFSPHINRVFSKLNIDLVHAHHPYWMGKKGMDMAKKYKIPIVYTYHTRFEKYIEHMPYINDRIGRHLSKHIVKNFAANCSHIFVPTVSAGKCLQELDVNIPFEVLPTGIDITRYNIKHKYIEEIRKRFLKESRILLLSVSRLSKEKNLYFLLEGLKYIKQNTTTKFACIIIGDGPEKRNVERYIRENGLIDEVYLLGIIEPEEINKYYLAADIFIFSSTSETQGMVIVEAMAASTPVVAVSSTGIDDIVQNGVNGYKTSEDIREWGDAVIKIMEDENMLERMALNACQTIKDYTMEAIARKALAVYDRLIKAK